MGSKVTDHEWKPHEATVSLAAAIGGIVVVDPENERRGWRCGRCGSTMTTAALGKLPTRVETSLFDPIGYSPREITGWETFEQGMKRCGVNPDCDFETVAGVTRSLSCWLLMERVNVDMISKIAYRIATSIDRERKFQKVTDLLNLMSKSSGNEKSNAGYMAIQLIDKLGMKLDDWRSKDGKGWKTPKDPTPEPKYDPKKWKSWDE